MTTASPRNSSGPGATTPATGRPCRFCGTPLSVTFADLGMTPLCQNRVLPEALDEMEAYYPLHALVCTQCKLVQLGEYVAPERIFDDYAYFSSYSDSWLDHARRYVEGAITRFGLTRDSFVVEVASNDGYLLRNFVAAGVPVLGIEPAANVAAAAQEQGIRTEVRFFGEGTARDVARAYARADLIVGNNVLAHVPDLNDFVAGLGHLLAPRGTVTMEFPHLLRLVEENQFDTIYHEHFSYFSFHTVQRVFAAHGMRIYDVEELSTHGGSLRIYAGHEASAPAPTDAVDALDQKELAWGVEDMGTYARFADRVRATKRDILSFLIEAKGRGKRIVGYGAPGKGNTLLNYCGIGTDFLDYTVDRSPHKQGTYTPGARIPVFHPDHIRETRPDYVFILPWNLKDEIMTQMAHIREWGGRFVVPIPSISVYE